MAQKLSLHSSGPYYRVDGLIPELFSHKVGIQELRGSFPVPQQTLLCANIFETPHFYQTFLKSNALWTAQVTYGPELFSYEGEIKSWLDHGHHLQIWFENPEQFSLVRAYSERAPGQISLVFVPTKKFYYKNLGNEIRSHDNLSILAAPKNSSLDSYLSLQEFYLLYRDLESQCRLGVLFLPELFADQPEAVRAFYEATNLGTFETALRFNHPLHYYFYGILKALKLFRLNLALEYIRVFLFTLLIPTPRIILYFLVWPLYTVWCYKTTLFWPVLKAWWFFSYQWKKRILRAL
jgi:hypothetical protein